jgi:hypothetical protein
MGSQALCEARTAELDVVEDSWPAAVQLGSYAGCGTLCGYCGEIITAESRRVEPRWWHVECLVRSVIGSVGHQKRMCHCYGEIDTSEDDLTLREAAVRSFRYFQRVEKTNRQ